jgi:hypothetical protein
MVGHTRYRRQFTQEQPEPGDYNSKSHHRQASSDPGQQRSLGGEVNPWVGSGVPNFLLLSHSRLLLLVTTPRSLSYRITRVLGCCLQRWPAGKWLKYPGGAEQWMRHNHFSTNDDFPVRLELYGKEKIGLFLNVPTAL